MNVEELFCILVVICVFSTPLFIWYSIHQEDKNAINKAKTMKAGDWYKWEYHYSNPFKEKIVVYVKIIEIRFANDGVPWVKYSIGGDNGIVESKPCVNFLQDYISCKEEKK